MTTPVIIKGLNVLRILGPLALAAAIVLPGASLAMESGGSNSDLCAQIKDQDWFQADWSCAIDGRGLALAAEGESAILAQTLDRSVDNFELYFGETDAKMAVIGAARITETERKFLSDAGYLVLPWVNQDSKRDLVRQSVERQVMEQTQGLPEAQRQAVLAQALAKLEASRGETSQASAPSLTETGALAHEAGHLLFIDLYDGAKETVGGAKQYGSTAPDWLDELAAVLNENDHLTSGRYAVARENLEQGETALAYSLDVYLTMDHPSLNAARALRERASGGGGSQVVALSGEEARKFLEESGGDPVQFYVQSRLFADYLIEATQEQKVFAALAKVIGSGGSFESWLSDNHAQYGLAGTADGFVEQWNAWIEAHLEQEGAV